MSFVKKATESNKIQSRSLLLEQLEGRVLCAIDYSDAIDFVRSTRAVQVAQSASIRTGTPQTVSVSGQISNTGQQDHSFLEKANLRGSFTADVTMRMDQNVLVQSFKVRENFTGRSRLDDIDLAFINADLSISGTYRVAVANRMVSKVLSADWRSEGTANVLVESGPARNSDYVLNLLSTDGREYGDKVSGLEASELVGNCVRNAVPFKSPLANWTGDVLQRAANLKIPGVDVQKALSTYSIVADLFSTPGSRSNDEIFRDLKNSRSFVFGIQSERDLLRFAQGGVTSIVGVKFDISKGWDRVIYDIPVATAAMFGGLVTASVGAEATLGIAVNLAGVFCADSRGFGLSEGTSASVELRLDSAVKGSVAIVGIDRWSLVGGQISAGVFVSGNFKLSVGSSSSNPEVLRHGAILYVTPNIVQNGSFASYLSANVSADVGAVLKAKVTVLGFTVWKKSHEKSWTFYNKAIFAAHRSLRQ